MCNRIISHYAPCLHQRCTSLEICSRNKASPGVDPFDCEIGGPVFFDEPSIVPCPVCLGELEKRVTEAREAWREVERIESERGEGSGGGEDGNADVWADVPWTEINEEILRQVAEESLKDGSREGVGERGESSRGESSKGEKLKGEGEGAKGNGDDEKLNARWAEMMAGESSNGSHCSS